jgi:hypothetical protein
MRNILYNDSTHRWEVITNFTTGACVGITWGPPTAIMPIHTLVIRRSTAHGDYREAKPEQLKLLITRIWRADKVEVYDNVRWDS